MFQYGCLYNYGLSGIMMLTEKKISRKSYGYKEVKDLYWNTFKDHDGFPMWYMTLRSRRDYVDINGYYDDGKFCGMSIVLKDPDVFYILYLAVRPELRSHGYGAEILRILSEEADGRNVVLDIEDPYEDCDDPEIRRRRLNFYLRNGFTETQYKYFDKDGKFLIMSKSGDASQDHLYEMLRKLSFGLYRADIHQDVSM